MSNASGAVPAFGESLIEVPVTASAMRMAHQFFGLVNAREPPDKLQYSMSGKLSGGGTFGSQRFEATGEFSLKPPEPAETATSI